MNCEFLEVPPFTPPTPSLHLCRRPQKACHSWEVPFGGELTNLNLKAAKRTEGQEKGPGKDMEMGKTSSHGLWGDRKSHWRAWGPGPPCRAVRVVQHTVVVGQGDRQAETEIQATLRLAKLRFGPEAASTQRNRLPFSNSSKGMYGLAADKITFLKNKIKPG